MSGSTTPKKSGFGKRALDWSFKVSDKLGGYANSTANKLGSEAFWPSAGDTPKELEKVARILQTFTRTGVEETIEKEVVDKTTGKKVKKQQRVLKKIPAKAIRQAKGIAIYTAFRTAIAPLGGAGGSGIIIARQPDGSWGPPSSITPNNLSTGFMIGLDIYDVVLLINTEKALQSFYSHKFTLGGEVSVTAGPVGAGAMLDGGKEMSPCWSYVKSRGFYAGVELNGTIIFNRTDEMARFYHRSEITAEEILTGKVHMPYEAKPLLAALEAAEKRNEEYLANADEVDGIPIPDDLNLADGETLHLPPTPDMLASEEGVGFRESWMAAEEREKNKIDFDADEEKIFVRKPPPRRNDLTRSDSFKKTIVPKNAGDRKSFEDSVRPGTDSEELVQGSSVDHTLIPPVLPTRNVPPLPASTQSGPPLPVRPATLEPQDSTESVQSNSSSVYSDNNDTPKETEEPFFDASTEKQMQDLSLHQSQPPVGQTQPLVETQQAEVAPPAYQPPAVPPRRRAVPPPPPAAS